MSVMADQQAAMFGECCFDVGDVKITMGTGTFMDINTGVKPHTSLAGLYPLVGWKIGSDVVYLAEGNAADTGTAIKWAQELELFSDVTETSDMAYSVSDSDGVCFVPSFSGLQAPLNDPRACASLMGLKPSTTKSHLVRAILESVAFRNKQLYETMLKETHIPITQIRVDGGVSSNDFVTQLTADLFGRKLVRPQHLEMSSLGAAFVAGLAVVMRNLEILLTSVFPFRFCPPPSKQCPSLPKPSPRLNKWGPTPCAQQPTDDDEYELCDQNDNFCHKPPGGPPPPRLPKPLPRESPKLPVLPRQDMKPRQFESNSLPVMHTEQKPCPKAFSLDLKRPKIPLPQFTPPKPAERGNAAAENGSTDQDKDADVYNKPWFASACDRKTADDALLRSNKDGAFMVRKSSGQDVRQPYTLVVFYNGRVYNIPIRFMPSTRQYALGREKKGEEYFSSVSHIIENHQRNLLVLIDSQSNSKDATKLYYPVKP
ncbi:hypothetical protein ILYODFUR_009381 [Ilyodon furcidens]|uniref:SH2 domain-containing protein n=1 Tax=Ilyodon furcidens TaxID=33524 RepID=A0ABV0SKG9_9TELE